VPVTGSPTCTLPATPGSVSLRGEAAIRPLAEAVAAKAGISKGLVLAVISQESAFNPRAVSGAGAQGLMQLMPGTVTHINAASGLSILDPFDPGQNLAGGCWYLKWVKSQVPTMKVVAGEEWKMALGGYNGGIGRVKTAIDKALAGAPRNPKASWADVEAYMPAETRKYVPSVVSKWDRYGR
jgi:soluble lytic murein transglycosylase-like protein